MVREGHRVMCGCTGRSIRATRSAPLLLDYEGPRSSDAIAEKVKHSIAAGGCAIRV